MLYFFAQRFFSATRGFCGYRIAVARSCAVIWIVKELSLPLALKETNFSFSFKSVLFENQVGFFKFKYNILLIEMLRDGQSLQIIISENFGL